MARKGSRSAKRRSTIKDVAADADVSISTVSLALNGTGYVAAETLKRVQDSVERLGYVARPAARQLASKKTGNIGFVLRADHFARSEPFYTHVFLGTEFEAERFDRYVLLATIPDAYAPGADAPRFLREQNVDGIIVAGKVADEFIAEAQEADVPIVLVDYEADDLPAVVIDNQAGARAAVDHLVGLGHRDIALVGADMQHPALRARLDGYQLALARANIGVRSEYILAEDGGNPNVEAGKSLVSRLLALTPRPSAVFCVNDAVAIGVMDALARAEISVPGQMSVVGFDDVVGAAMTNPPLTTVRVFKAQLGELAVRYLDELITTDANPSRETHSRGSAESIREGGRASIEKKASGIESGSSPERALGSAGAANDGSTRKSIPLHDETARVADGTTDDHRSTTANSLVDEGPSAMDAQGSREAHRRPHDLKVPVELVVRASTGPLPGGGASS